MYTCRLMYSETVNYDNTNYEIICIPETDSNGQDTLSMYIQPSGKEFAMEFMFGHTPNDLIEDNIADAFQIAEACIPEQVEILKETRWF